ncbi:reticulophagy regulator 1-like [Coccinella septempunctata]|uniref:reticulophagy regulator 1-like n=1 Tax=Coccinella septempunctata TaxID=41139 RepID=UPI001D0702CF|nr:reticulophagy regulator 1-like [Coccinella septempunctata]
MESLLSILRRFKRDVNILAKDEYTYFGDICMMLSWKYPYYTLTNFIVLNFFLWLAAYSQFQLLGLIFTIILIKFLYQNTLGFQMNTQSFSANHEEFLDKFRNLITSISLYRNDNPSEFCVMMSLFFFILAYIASIFSGVLLSFFSLWCIFLTPLAYANMPPNMKEKLENVLSTLGRFQATIQEEDLFPLPVENNDNEDLESLGTDRTADSVTNSLISGMSSMPSFLDAEDDNEIMEEDLMPINPSQNHELSPNYAELSTDSESEIKDIAFKESQFSRGSSSDEDGAFEEGLRFEETQNQSQQEPKGLVHNIVDYVTSTGGFQLPNFFNNATTSMQSTGNKNISRESSTSEEDFEIIDANELKQ